MKYLIIVFLLFDYGTRFNSLRRLFFYIDAFIHDVCSSQAITSRWGTLKTPNFPHPYTSNDDCWCKLSTQLQYRLLLSVIIFQLIPYDRSYFDII